MRPGPGPRQPSPGNHPKPTASATHVPEPRSGNHGDIPVWPESLIEPVERELARWCQLWSRPQAAVWARKGQADTVATLVRLEMCCAQARRPPSYRIAELARLRRELGLTLDV